MITKQTKALIGLLIFLVIGGSIMADRRGQIYRLGSELERLAVDLALSSYDHFKNWGGEINEREQGVLFKSVSFVASSQLFLKLTKGDSDYFGTRYVRTNLYNAFIYLAGSFNGRLVIEQSNRPNRLVFLIERGKKRGLTSPQVVQRYGGWKNVFEVPIEVINKYPEGEPIR